MPLARLGDLALVTRCITTVTQLMNFSFPETALASTDKFRAVTMPDQCTRVFFIKAIVWDYLIQLSAHHRLRCDM